MTPRLVTWLAVLACLQLGIAALLLWPEAPTAPDASADGALLPLAREDIRRIEVTDREGNALALVRRDARWLIAGNNLPAAGSAVDRLLDGLSQAVGFPVARSDGARERFEVAPNLFQRRITLSIESDASSTADADSSHKVTVYLGTSPGMRRVHARRDDSAAIRAIPLSTFDVPASVDGWLDPSLLAPGPVSHLASADRAWEKVAGEWQAREVDNRERAAPVEALEALVRRLESLQVSGLAVPADTAGLSDESLPELLVGDAGDRVVLRLAPATDDRPALIYSSAFEHWFSLSDYDSDRLTDAMSDLESRSSASQGPRNKNRPSILKRTKTGTDAPRGPTSPYHHRQ